VLQPIFGEMLHALSPHSPATRPAPDVGADLHALVADLLPLRRCLTGNGLRATLARLGEVVPIETTEVPTGEAVFDWTIPPEWRVHEAHLTLPSGRRVADWSASPLHLVQYSGPVRGRMAMDALRPHLHSLPDQPRLVPYRTAYYAPTWGFCLAHDDLDAMSAELGDRGEAEVVIDADLFDGSLTYGEAVVPGETEDEILISAHACHPALANDNASALAVAATLAAERLAGSRRRHTLRVLFAPGTLGAVAWLSRNRARWGHIQHGLVLANLGDAGGFTYKQTRRGTLAAPLAVDRAVALALRDAGQPLDVRPWTPDGYDERQFGSPGIDLPVGRLTRTPHGEYPEYHTSGDSLALVRPDALAGSLAVLRDTLAVLDGDGRYQNLAPFGEPQLGRRGLYAPIGGIATPPQAQAALSWTLALADGEHSLLDTSERSALPFGVIRTAADRLLAADLLAPAGAPLP
jgi:aminopeptidase-like protein